ncbi:patched domain-containing protein 3-like isoform X1 [Anguilla rostrata]|uniref:patched domain-containing protein 3-like isoform X1 n=1 Tax=Anguilla rostrata TaxID=7938 RepID=UPI0030CF23DF
MTCCKTDCIEKPLSRLFEKFGRIVGNHPFWFLIIPLLLSAGLGGGFYFLKERETNDIEEQYTPVNGPAKRERDFVKENFPQNDTMFSSQRLYTDGTYASLIAVFKSNVLSDAELETGAFERINNLDKQVINIAVKDGREQFTFKDICAKSSEEIKFPGLNLTSQFGGINKSDSVLAIRLYYYIQQDNKTRSDLWLDQFRKFFSSRSTISDMEVFYFTSKSLQEEFEKNSEEVIPLFSGTYILGITFSIISCMRLDCVRNKVWVAALGVLSAGLAVLSSFGLMLYIGVPFAMTVANSPFLILGIGVDDMFILISCWQQTNVHAKVEDRLADTYKEAACSITITTLTDVLAFYVGLITPFRSVWSFCLYTSSAILFCYIYSITFFGAVLVLNGRRENSNRHWLICKKVPEECPPGRSKVFSLCCVGGAYDHQTGYEEIQPMNHFFKMYYGPFLTKTWTKAMVILLYAAYLAGSIYGCFQIQQGLDLKNLVPDSSYTVKYYKNEKEYFAGYGPNVMIIVKNQFPYWNENSRFELDTCIEDFKNQPYVKKNGFTSWLKSYEDYAVTNNLNLKDETVFKTNLCSFLENSDIKQDVNFTKQSIHSTRFFIQMENITTAVDEMKMLNTLRDTARKCPVPLLVYHPAFIYYDQYTFIVSNTIQNIVVTTGVMLLISLLLIPNPVCSLWVTFSIASIIVGVTGYMALWDVNLDSISMIILVVCIGFSVDFSAHISYAFVSSNKPTANEKAIDALYTLGYPIVQGAVSTIVGVVVLSASQSYIFRTFFKIMFLVILIGLFHAITFIPVFLTLFDICRSPGESNGQDKLTYNDKKLENTHNPSTQHDRKILKKRVYENGAFYMYDDRNQIREHNGVLSIDNSNPHLLYGQTSMTSHTKSYILNTHQTYMYSGINNVSNNPHQSLHFSDMTTHARHAISDPDCP